MQIEEWKKAGLLTVNPDGIAEYQLTETTQPGPAPQIIKHDEANSDASAAPVLFVHGREGNAGQFALMAADVVRNGGGRAVLLFDFGSHGLSKGHTRQGELSERANETTYPLLLEELKTVVDRHYPIPIGSACPHVPALVAHSAGCAVARMALHRGYFTVDRLALVSSIPGSLREQQAHFIENLLGVPAMLPSFQCTFEKRFPGEMDEWDETTMRGVPTAATTGSVLLIHGTNDTAAPMRLSSERWAAEAGALAEEGTEKNTSDHEKHRRVRYLPLADAGHVRILTDPRTIRAIALFVSNARGLNSD